MAKRVEERVAGEQAAVFVTRSPKMLEIVELLERLATVGSNVLISGESGTGKDVAAHALHFWGPRAESAIVKVDLPAIPAELLESELFGYEKGAFTGASGRKIGKLEMAKGGTLFLDQIGELTPALQAKLLRVVEDKQFERLGGTELVAMESRIVASASADLEQAVERQLFRRDLFHRLGVFWIQLPPLRERPEDIELLATLFLGKDPGGAARVPRKFSEETMQCFQSYGWPGNVRELKSVVERGALMARGETVEPADLPDYVLESPWTQHPDRRPTLADVEKSYIERILREVGGNQTRAAEILGISRKSLWERRRRYGLE